MVCESESNNNNYSKNYVHLIVHLINQMFVGRMQMLERLTPDVTSMWRE